MQRNRNDDITVFKEARPGAGHPLTERDGQFCPVTMLEREDEIPTGIVIAEYRPRSGERRFLAHTGTT
jgi:hypothetical protein